MKGEQVEKIVLRHEQKVTGELGFAFLDLKTGEEFYRNREHTYPTASTFKVFLLAELFRQAQEGRFRMEDRIELRESDKREGSGILDELQEGAALTIRDYAYLMMSLSDNTATDMLFRLVGQENIQENVLNRYGLENSKCDWDCKMLTEECFQVTGGTYDTAFSYRNLPHFVCKTEKNDQTTPEDMMKVLKLLAQRKLISQYVSDNMIEIMEKCQMNYRIPRYLPREAVVVHKRKHLRIRFLL